MQWNKKGRDNRMDTVILKVNEDSVTKDEMNQASEILKQGGLVAFPTETVYGLGADGLNASASKKIYEAKGRPSDNPLILHIATLKALDKLTKVIPDKAMKLANAFWPGPLTMIFQKSDLVPYGTTGGLDTVAIRMPSHPVAKALIEASNLAIAAPSANTSGRPSPTMASHVWDDLQGKIDMIIDGGAVGIGIESTIVDVTMDKPVILRPGYITKDMLEQIVGPVEIDPAIMGKMDPSIAPKAPGMKYKHYAPKGQLTIVEGPTEAVVDQINDLVEEKLKAGYTVGVIATTETKDQYKTGVVRTIGSRSDEVTIARGLYSVLREFDDLGADYIYTESFRETHLGQAIMNRLLKAAGYDMIRVNNR